MLQPNDKGYQLIKRELSKFLNLEDNMYKDTYLLRRISARARRLGMNNLMDYYLFLKKNKNELEQLLLTITINTTEFFRDPIVWKTFQNKLLPEIIRYKWMNNLKEIRIWSAACSSGQEPYSIAMVVHEVLGGKLDRFKVSILATDIDTKALATAMSGIYPKNIVDKQVPPSLRKKYFIDEGDYYKVSSSLKKLITFKHFNLLSKSYPKGFDIIFLRNVLIYMTHEAQGIVFKNIYSSLQDHGYLILGRTESIIGKFAYLFRLYDLSSRVYKKNLELIKNG